MKALEQKSTDIQAMQFFESCKDELQRLAHQNMKEKESSKLLSKMKKFEERKQTKVMETKEREIEKMLMNNIVIDFMKSNDCGYSYPVFMRECNLISEEIVSKGKLAAILGIQEEYAKDDRMNVSVLEFLIQKVSVLNKKTSLMLEMGTQVNLLQRNGEENKIEIFENRIEGLRKEIEEREKKSYELQLENVRKMDNLTLKEDFKKEFDQKYMKEKEKLSKEYSELLKKTIKASTSEVMTEENNKLLAKNYDLQKELNVLKEENEKIKKEQLKHDCCKSSSYLKLSENRKQERQELEEKKREYDLALRNLSTKVEDLVTQKNRVQNENKTDNFMREVQVRRENKDHMIETMYGEIKQMEYRVKVLADENNGLREHVKELKGVMKSKEEFYSQIKESHLDQNNNSMILQNPSNTGSLNSTLNLKTQSMNNSLPFQGKVTVNKIPSFIRPTQDICIGVNEAEIEAEKNEGPKSVNSSQISSNFEEAVDAEMEYQIKINKVQAEMNLIKNKVRLLVSDEDYF